MFLKKLFLFILVLFFFSFYVSFVSAVKIGLNVAGQHGDIDNASNLVGPGGWIVLIGSPSDVLKAQIETISAKGVNVVIRAGHTAGQDFSSYPSAWSNFFASLSTAQYPNKLYFMPLNEPNNTAEGLSCSDPGIKAYLNTLVQVFKPLEARVTLLSPGLDAHALAGDMSCYTELGGAGLFSQFGGVVFHAYGSVNPDGTISPGAHPFQRGDVGAFLSALSLPSATPVYILETGVVCPTCSVEEQCGQSQVKYPFSPICAERIEKYLNQVNWGQLDNVRMFSIINYDPPDFSRGPWTVFSFVSGFMDTLKSLIGGGASTPAPAGAVVPGAIAAAVTTPEPIGVGNKTDQVSKSKFLLTAQAISRTGEQCGTFEYLLSYLGLVDCNFEDLQKDTVPQASLLTESKEEGVVASIVSAVAGFLGIGEKAENVKTVFTPYGLIAGETTGESSEAETQTESTNCVLVNMYTPHSIQSDCSVESL